MINKQNSKAFGVLWVQYGPYHSARFAALKQRAGSTKVHALEFSSQTSVYAWNRSDVPENLTTLCPGTVAEELPFLQVFWRARRTFAELKLDVCFLPSYAPSQPLAALLAAKSLGIRTVMMNESHAGTSRARGLAAIVKRLLVGLFDTAFVGGHPQQRYIASLGLPENKIFLGYDAVDNDFFATKSEEIRSRQLEIRAKYQLPEHYFLSLGRFVAKKNLATLIKSYRQLLDLCPACKTHLVMVGSGEEEPRLKALCQELKLPVCDKTALEIGNRKPASAKLPAQPGSEIGMEAPGVHFYGFRQVAESPVFYALADAFVLPSLWEEWGLVVNEAMASGLPVVVSETAGCAEDLLRAGRPCLPDPLTIKPPGHWPRMDHFIRQNGFVFDPGSVASLANALLTLELNPTVRTVMGQHSREVVDQFSCQNFAQNALLAAHAALDGEVVPGKATTTVSADADCR